MIMQYTKEEEKVMRSFQLTSLNIKNLSIYVEELLKWNKSINLISKSDEDKIWDRHIIDSLSLVKYLNTNTKIIDVGTGAGLPGMVLAIVGYKHITLVDKNSKKIAFLNFIASRFNIDVSILNQDISDVKVDCDVIITRAFSSIDAILKLTNHIPHNRILLMKGQNANRELQAVSQDLLKKFPTIRIYSTKNLLLLIWLS